MTEDGFLFDTIAIAGVGLIGGSLGMAAKRRSLTHRVIGLGRSEQKLMRAKILGAIDEYSLDLDQGASEADLVIICTPVRTIIPTLERMGPYLKKGAVVTDAGSTKREIVELAPITLPEKCFFVGGHPMAGSEQTGVDAAYPDLFLNATYVLTSDENTNVFALGKMTAFAEAIGARVEVMTPEQHDKATAVISHLPHAVSSVLLQLAEDSQRHMGKTFRMAAGSFRDLTRISDSSPDIWRDICLTNADYIIDEINRFQKALEGFKEALEAEDEAAIEHFFEQAKHIRETYLRITN